MDKIITIWFKEIKDNIRDRRTVMSMVVMPMIIIPLLLVGITKLTKLQIDQSKNEKSVISISNATAAPDLVAAISHDSNVTIVNSTDMASDIKNKKIDLGITVPDTFNQDISNQSITKLQIMENETNTKSATALSRIAPIIATYNNALYVTRLTLLHVSPKVLSPVTYTVSDLSTDQQKGGLLLGLFLPIFIVMWSIVGGQYIAIDTSAGEKERKTLEALLLTPTNRMQMVFGKLFAVTTVALISVVLSLVSMYVSIKYVGLNASGANTLSSSSGSSLVQSLGNINVSLSAETIAILLLVSVLLVVMFSAILLSIGIFAKSFKEAQSYIAPAYIIVILPIVFANIAPDFKPSLSLFFIPAVNAVFLFKELILQTYDLSHILATVVSLLIFAVLAVFVATRIYNRESVLFN